MKREFHIQMLPNPEFYLIHHHRCRHCAHPIPCERPKCFRIARSKHMKKWPCRKCPHCWDEISTSRVETITGMDFGIQGANSSCTWIVVSVPITKGHENESTSE